jgi:hypothetical protein
MGTGIGIGTRQAVVLSALILAPLTVRAQEPDEDRRSVRLAAGAVSQKGTFGDDNPLPSASQLGPTLSVGLRRHPTHLVGLAFDAALEPTAVNNPHYDESVSHAYLQLGPEIGRRIYIRPTVGGSLNFWSGGFSSGSVSLGPAAALAVGYRQKLGADFTIHPEFIARTAIEIGALTHSVGVQVAVSRRTW